MVWLLKTLRPLPVVDVILNCRPHLLSRIVNRGAGPCWIGFLRPRQMYARKPSIRQRKHKIIAVLPASDDCGFKPEEKSAHRHGVTIDMAAPGPVSGGTSFRSAFRASSGRLPAERRDATHGCNAIAFRGLKPTATGGASLRDADANWRRADRADFGEGHLFLAAERRMMVAGPFKARYGERKAPYRHGVTIA
jgi:hypothetical protein